MSEEPRPLVARRVTIPFAVRVTTDLDWLIEHTELKQVDVVNRAVQVYSFIERAIADGKMLLLGKEVTDAKGNKIVETERVTIV